MEASSQLTAVLSSPPSPPSSKRMCIDSVAVPKKGWRSDRLGRSFSWKRESGSVDVSVGSDVVVNEFGLPVDLAAKAFMKAPGGRVDGIVFASLVQVLESGDERARVSTDDKSLSQGKACMMSFDCWVGSAHCVVDVYR